MGKAIVDLLSARLNKDRMQQFAVADNVPWTLSHAFLVNMGGFAIEFKENSITASVPTPATPQPQPASNGCASPVVDITPTSAKQREYSYIGNEANTSISTSPLASDHNRHLEEQSSTAEQKVTLLVRARDIKANNTKDVSLRTQQFREFCISQMKRNFYGLNMWGHYKLAKTRWRPNHRNWNLVQEVIHTLEKSHLGHQNITSYYENVMALRGSIWILDGQQLVFAREQGIIKQLPNIPEDEIEEKSKGHAFIKMLAVIQVLWLTVQLITRKARGLPATQLETMTLAFSVCSFFTYLLLWSKPQDVRIRI